MSRLKICKKCGREFYTETRKHFAYMCPECRLEEKRGSVYKERVCVICGQHFMGYPASRFCPDCKRKRVKEQKRKYNTTKPSRHIGSVDMCQECGKEYIVSSGLQKYCPECSEKMISEKERARKRKYAEENKDIFQARKKDTNGKRYVCAICGKEFQKTTARVTCSDECEKELLRIRQNKADIKRGKRKRPAEERYESDLPKSGVPGITWRKNGKWQVTYKRKYIGVYDSIENAKRALEDFKNKN